MVGIGTLLALLGVWQLGVWLKRRRLPDSDWFYRARRARRARLARRADRRLGHDRGRAPAVGRLPRDAHLAGRHRRRRHPRRLRDARRSSYLGVACGVVWILRRLARVPLRERRPPRAPAERRAGELSMHLYDAPADLRPRRPRALRRARRRRLRQRLLAAARRPRTDAARARPRARRDRARLGGQPRLADLRPDRHLDRLPERVRLDRLDALRAAVHRRDRHRPARRRLRAARRRAERTRAPPDRPPLLALLDPHAVCARHRRRRDRRAPGARRQRRRQPARAAGPARPR